MSGADLIFDIFIKQNVDLRVITVKVKLQTSQKELNTFLWPFEDDVPNLSHKHLIMFIYLFSY